MIPSKCSSSSRETMWEAFHRFRISPVLRNNWNSMVNRLGVESPVRGSLLLLQFIVKIMLHHFIVKAGHEASTLRPKAETATHRVELRDTECQVIRYISGYVPYVLIKRYSRQKNNMAAQTYVDTLTTWRYKTSNPEVTNFLSYMRHWVDMVNRGGLFLVSDEVYPFFHAVELEARPHLTVESIHKYAGTSVKLKDLLMDKLETSTHVASR